MKQLFMTLRKTKAYMDEAEEIYEKIKATGEPTPFLVLLPLVYKHAMEKNQETPLVDERVLAAVSQYLKVRYPVLSTYFVGKQHQEAINALRKTLDDFIDEKNKGQIEKNLEDL